MGASVVLGHMEQTGLWGQVGDGPNKLMGQIEAWGKRRMEQTGLKADRTNVQSDVWVTARSLAIKRGNASLVFRYGIQSRSGGALNFRGFALPWGNSFAHYSWSRSAAFFIWKGIPHGNAREFGTARSGAD